MQLPLLGLEPSASVHYWHEHPHQRMIQDHLAMRTALSAQTLVWDHSDLELLNMFILYQLKISWVSSFRMLIYLAVSIAENVFHFEKWKLPLWSLSSDKHSYPLMLLDKPETSMKISGRYRILCHHKTTRAPMTKRVIAPAMLPRTTFSLEFFDPPGCIMIKYLAWEKCTYNLPQNLVFSRDCQFVIKVPVLVLPPSHENKCWPQFKWLPV